MSTKATKIHSKGEDIMHMNHIIGIIIFKAV